eukprot:TRINITY_DN10339_c0_g1_i1.p1 TRINITY_DN10339_c0_g1~~TRINITY_DN10339_c0_g1_i1.p1  ORF type:complete len:700 (+),score=130.28 TRINITY_DN10339_c0_g1_i1:72-2171(+)
MPKRRKEEEAAPVVLDEVVELDELEDGDFVQLTYRSGHKKCGVVTGDVIDGVGVDVYEWPYRGRSKRVTSLDVKEFHRAVEPDYELPPAPKASTPPEPVPSTVEQNKSSEDETTDDDEAVADDLCKMSKTDISRRTVVQLRSICRNYSIQYKDKMRKIYKTDLIAMVMAKRAELLPAEEAGDDGAADESMDEASAHSEDDGLELMTITAIKNLRLLQLRDVCSKYDIPFEAERRQDLIAKVKAKRAYLLGKGPVDDVAATAEGGGKATEVKKSAEQTVSESEPGETAPGQPVEPKAPAAKPKMKRSTSRPTIQQAAKVEVKSEGATEKAPVMEASAAKVPKGTLKVTFKDEGATAAKSKRDEVAKKEGVKTARTAAQQAPKAAQDQGAASPPERRDAAKRIDASADNKPASMAAKRRAAAALGPGADAAKRPKIIPVSAQLRPTLKATGVTVKRSGVAFSLEAAQKKELEKAAAATQQPGPKVQKEMKVELKREKAVHAPKPSTPVPTGAARVRSSMAPSLPSFSPSGEASPQFSAPPKWTVEQHTPDMYIWKPKGPTDNWLERHVPAARFDPRKYYAAQNAVRIRPMLPRVLYTNLSDGWVLAGSTPQPKTVEGDETNHALRIARFAFEMMKGAFRTHTAEGWAEAAQFLGVLRTTPATPESVLQKAVELAAWYEERRGIFLRNREPLAGMPRQADAL